MSKFISLMAAAAFAVVAASPVAMAQTQKREQVDKGTATQGSTQKKAAEKREAKDRKKDGSGEGKQGKK